VATLSASLIALTTAAGMTAAAGPYKVVVSGSTTVCPIAQGLVATYQGSPADAYHHPDSTIVTSDAGTAGVDCPGSGTGIKNLLNGTADVADASRPVKTTDTGISFTTGQVDSWVVALDGITVIMNNSPGSGTPTDVTSLTVSQLKGIFNCTITTWNQVGSASTAAIKPQSRSTASGTFGDFFTFIGGSAPTTVPACDTVANPDSNPGVLSATQTTPQGIGYVGMGFAFINGVPAANIRIINVDGIAPNTTSVVSAIQTLVGPTPFSQAPAPDTAPNGTEYVFGRQLFMDTIKPNNLPNCTGGTPPAICSNPGVPNRQNNSARAIEWVNGAVINNGQTTALNNGVIGLVTHNATVDSVVFPAGFACQTVSNGSYCPQVIPPWDVNAERVTNIDAVTQVGIDWNKAAPAGTNCGWLRSDVLCEGVVNIDAVTKIGNHWNESWTQWVD
jgi:phosphate transport system substrate-binding protein